MFTREDTTSIPAPLPMRTRSRLTRSFITTEKVRKKIRQLKPHSAAGPDGIAPKLLQQCEDQIVPVLAMIYRKSMKDGQVPEEWRTATVIPIFKKRKEISSGKLPTCVAYLREMYGTGEYSQGRYHGPSQSQPANQTLT